MEAPSSEHPLGIDLPDGILRRREEYGGKTVRLAELTQKGFRVPPFLGVSHMRLLRLDAGDELGLRELGGDVQRLLPVRSYAVRSSAFAEDGTHSSHAGEFMTKLHVAPSKLWSAMADVLRDARAKGYGTPERSFSLLIQEFIEPTRAGVIFTRNPLGGAEMVLEWRVGRGDAVVGGKTPHRIMVFNEDVISAEGTFTEVKELVRVARGIEQSFAFPQDIEWAIKDGMVHILQSRPLSNITDRDWRGYELLLHELSDKREYYYRRSGVAETFVRPKSLPLEILRSLYRPGGPIARAYESFGMSYAGGDHFRIFGNILFVDEEEELREFFPTHSYFGGKTLVPHWVRIFGAMRTFTNMVKLASLPIGKREEYRMRLHTFFADAPRYMECIKSWKEAVGVFHGTYELIFSVNLLSEHAYRRLLRALPKDAPVTAVELLSVTLPDVKDARSDVGALIPPDLCSRLSGNSLDLADQSPFTVFSHSVPANDERILQWWSKLRAETRRALSSDITIAREWFCLREEARWATVVLMSILRERLFAVTRKANVPDELAFFASSAEVLHHNLPRSALEERKKEYGGWNDTELPFSVSSRSVATPAHALGVSRGVARGVIATPSLSIAPGSVLLLDSLGPQYAPLLPLASGILAREGGILSHLSIIAREQGIPVVVDAVLYRSVKPGDTVEIDGGNGSARVITKLV